MLTVYKFKSKYIVLKSYLICGFTNFIKEFRLISILYSMINMRNPLFITLAVFRQIQMIFLRWEGCNIEIFSNRTFIENHFWGGMGMDNHLP